MVYWEVTPWTLTTEHSQLITGLIFSYMEYGCLLLGDEAIYYAKWMISLDVITTMLMMLSITGTFTCCIQDIFFDGCRHLRCVYILRTTLRSNQHT